MKWCKYGKSLEDYLKSTESIKGATGSSASILNIPDFFQTPESERELFLDNQDDTLPMKK
ncbi:MAG: hypothetical protein R3B65_02220 [Candidatus Paceibacterota bacterium]